VANLFGPYELLAKSGLFDAQYYIRANPDLATLNIDPLLHYVEQGAQEGRSPCPDFDVRYYLEQCRQRGEEPSNPLLHFVTLGVQQGLKTQAPDEEVSNTDLQARSKLQEPDTLILGIDSVAVDKMSDDSLQLTMRGWAIADEAIAQISMSLGETVLGYAAHGFPRPDVAAVHSDYPKADHCGFSVVVDSLPDGFPETLALSLTVDLAGGKRCLRPFSFNMATSEVIRKSSDRERTRPASRRHWTTPPLRLEIDDIEVNARGVLEASGWAVCFLDIEAIRLFIGDECLGAAEYGRAREDVASTCPEYPRARQSGFHFKGQVGHLGAGRRMVKVQALTQSGISREAIFPVTIPEIATPSAGPEVFHFHCDELALTTRGNFSIAGWAVLGASTESIVIRIDDAEVGLASLEIERPDVGNLFNQFPHARHAGFAFRQSLSRQLAPGEHILTLRIKDKAGAVREMPLPIQAVVPATEETAASAGALDSDPARSMFIDFPKIVNGAAETSVTSSLTIAGWALAKSGIQVINIAVDGKHISTAHYGVRRDDVASAYPDRSDALLSGFAALIPNWSLPKGQHTMSISLFDREDKTASVEFSIQVEEMPEGDGPWCLRRKIAQFEVDLQTRVLAGLKWRPAFQLLIKMQNCTEGVQKARMTLASLRDQAYTEWNALLIVDSGEVMSAALRKSLLLGFDELAKKVAIFSGKRSTSLAAVTGFRNNRLSQSLFLSAIAAGDVLGCDALLEMAVATGLDRDCDFFYSDERCISPVTKTIDAYFKPAWSPDLLLSTNYIGRLWTANSDLIERAGSSVGDWLEHGDYELTLRATENAQTIQHVPKVLWERDVGNADSAETEKGALSRALGRRGIKATIKKGCAPGIYRVKRKRKTGGMVSIIIPTCAARGLIKACLESLKAKTAYRNYEIICIENIPAEKSDWKRWLRENADDVIETAEPFNWSRYNNLCAERATGEFFLFLNDDIEVIEPQWLDTLLQQAERPEVGAVGPQLLYADRSVQHAGMGLTAVGKARHVFRHARADDPGYYGLALTERNVIGVTGACLLTRREVFDAVGRFDEAHTIVNNDLDYCLKTWTKGYVNIYTPHAQLIHHELASRGELGDDYDSSAFVGEWRDVFLKGDPYLNPNLSRHFDDLSPEREPIKVIYAGHPLLARESVHRILIVKLDHIGDCITALPAVRRLKELFPKARFCVLANRATKSIWAAEVAVDEVLEFDFFHARSGLGKKDLASQDLLDLRQRLEPFRFDLAVDLRKSPDTRHVLQYTGARFLAGYDHRGQYPWLDITLEWEGDTRYAPKHQNVADDILNLVEAIGTSCRSERSTFRADPKIALTLPAAESKQIFCKRVVCIHPASGSEMRQWPAEYFAELIDLLLAHHDVHVIIVGGPDEMDIAQTVLDGIRQRSAVYCLVGKLKLAELPALISKCALFVGNNSGPKHIAAALGVPTIGVHSGVIDSYEWGPLGDNAVAIRRNMSCSPCYLEKSNDCPKELACIRGLGAGSVYRLAARMLAIRGNSATVIPIASRESYGYSRRASSSRQL
jgi:ADP-heptose:LPS heptosyltransferase/GT2 family glycosyltransferase